jgi:hypothetical protein
MRHDCVKPVHDFWITHIWFSVFCYLRDRPLSRNGTKADYNDEPRPRICTGPSKRPPLQILSLVCNFLRHVPASDVFATPAIYPCCKPLGLRCQQSAFNSVVISQVYATPSFEDDIVIAGVVWRWLGLNLKTTRCSPRLGISRQFNAFLVVRCQVQMRWPSVVSAYGWPPDPTARWMPL